MIDINDEFFEIIDSSQDILIIQSDRPDGDSLASALFLEELLEQTGKHVHLYCGVNVPEYLRFISGWDRVSPDLPHKTDCSILVDNASIALIEKFQNNQNSLFIKSKPFIVVDHHDSVECDIPFASLNISKANYSSCGELLYHIFKSHDYKIGKNARSLVMQSILSDTLGLTNDLATAQTYRVMAELIDEGVSRAELEEKRKEYSKLVERVFRYKAELMQRSEIFLEGQLAICTIPEKEAFDVGTLYNPGPLILSELLMIKDIKVAIALKVYSKRATAAIRCTYGNAVADELARSFGGGGHPHSAGFKIENFNGDVSSLKSAIIDKLSKLLANDQTI